MTADHLRIMQCTHGFLADFGSYNFLELRYPKFTHMPRHRTHAAIRRQIPWYVLHNQLI